ncbi:MAG TPA: hypothetical protein P5092_15995 [Ruminococcus sp.]|jgi:hypothetical protein|nr:hypothetical protein [Ruminococcus sp.]
MDEVSAIIQELDSIIRELEDVSSDLRSKFQGIYTSEKIAPAIDDKVYKLRQARGKLNTIDRSKVDE